MPNGTSALLIVNPASGAAEKSLDAGLACLQAHGIDVIREAPQGPEHVSQLMARYRSQVDRVIIGGGDGSMNMALPGLMKHGLPLGILPMGTANDLARTLGVPEDLQAACEIIATGNTRQIDIGEVNGFYFFNVAHIGLAVEVARRSDGEMKKRLGAFAYPYAAWTAFKTRKTFSVALHCDDDSRSLRAVQVSVGNGRFYGGGVPIAEDATIDDGRLDLYAIPAGRWHRLMAMIPALRSGRTKQDRGIITMAGETAEVRTTKPKTVAVDGEEMTQTPAKFRVLRAALTVFAATHQAGLSEQPADKRPQK